MDKINVLTDINSYLGKIETISLEHGFDKLFFMFPSKKMKFISKKKCR